MLAPPPRDHRTIDAHPLKADTETERGDRLAADSAAVASRPSSATFESLISAPTLEPPLA